MDWARWEAWLVEEGNEEEFLAEIVMHKMAGSIFAPHN
jgi:hypothetical protein